MRREWFYTFFTFVSSVLSYKISTTLVDRMILHISHICDVHLQNPFAEDLFRGLWEYFNLLEGLRKNNYNDIWYHRITRYMHSSPVYLLYKGNFKLVEWTYLFRLWGKRKQTAVCIVVSMKLDCQLELTEGLEERNKISNGLFIVFLEVACRIFSSVFFYLNYPVKLYFEFRLFILKPFENLLVLEKLN